jgi:hypothetical protein
MFDVSGDGLPDLSSITAAGRFLDAYRAYARGRDSPGATDLRLHLYLAHRHLLDELTHLDGPLLKALSAAYHPPQQNPDTPRSFRPAPTAGRCPH